MTAPWLYRFVQRVAAPGAERRLRELLRHWLENHPPPGRCLDVGCGPDSWLRVAGLQPVGVDSDARRVAAFERRHGRAVCAPATALPFTDGEFDSVWSFGLLHHLPDDDARRAVKEMLRVTRDGGCTVIFDAVLPRVAWKHPLATLLRRMDQGKWMRSQERLETLLVPSGDWEQKRLTYALTGLEGLLCTRRVSATA
jgi:SAM-dependent methyltransferase